MFKFIERKILFQVVQQDLSVLADISASSAGIPQHKQGSTPEIAYIPTPQHHVLNTYFTKFMINLLRLFNSDRKLLEDKGSFIIRFSLHFDQFIS